MAEVKKSPLLLLACVIKVAFVLSVGFLNK
jgi:hypothetical protein